MKKKKMKKVLPAALACLTLIGASAWLTNKEVATGVNKITVGTTELVFKNYNGVDDNSDDSRNKTVINLSGNTAIPMTEAYARASTEIGAYKFQLSNTGSMDLDYKIYLVCEENTFGYRNADNLVSVLNLDIDAEDGNEIPVTAISADETADNHKQLVYSGTLNSKSVQDFEGWKLYIDEVATTDETQTTTTVDNQEKLVGQSAKYHLEVVAEQHDTTNHDTISATLLDGSSFNDKLKNALGSATKLVFTNTAIPSTVATVDTGDSVVLTDYSEAQDGSVVGWLDGDTYYISSGSSDIKIKANADASNMFSYCSRLTTLDLSNFDTSAVTDMSNMFSSCSSLTTLDLSNFDTSAVTNMGNMFNGCSSLTSLDLSNFDTSAVINMGFMFSGCSSLTSLDLSNFDTSAVTNMSGMFFGCSSLTTLDLSNFDTSAVTNMGNMFNGCSSLTSLDLSNFDTSAVTNMSDMFSRCSALTTITVKDEATKTKLESNAGIPSNTSVVVKA